MHLAPRWGRPWLLLGYLAWSLVGLHPFPSPTLKRSRDSLLLVCLHFCHGRVEGRWVQSVGVQGKAFNDTCQD